MTDLSIPRPLLTIVSNADEKFFPGLAVAVTSAVAAASGKYDYHFLILDGGLNTDSLLELQEISTQFAEKNDIRVTIRKLEIDQSRLLALPERRGSRMTYAKLVLPEILPRLDSIIYLDADVLCFAGIENIQPPNDEGAWLLAGARDFFCVIEKDCPWLNQVPLAERRLPYINCGVMWMNLKGLREINFTNQSITARASIGHARQGDQSVFNYICRGKSYILPDLMNHRTAIGSSRLLCDGNLNLNIHYIGSPKPWLGPPKTSNWLAHQLWHQANRAIFSRAEADMSTSPPHDLATIRRKALLYTLLNPSRAAHYRSDLDSLKDPGKILEHAAQYWASQTE
jgi:lipopolysaccharide biosynthesis glycosyltransferase